MEKDIAIGGPDVGSEEDDSIRGKDDREIKKKMLVADGRLGIGWTVGYYFVLVSGALGFWKGLWVLTESKGSLADFRPR